MRKKPQAIDLPAAFRGITEACYPGKDCGLTSVRMYLYYFDSGTTSPSSKQRCGKGHNCYSNHYELGDCFFHIVLLRHIVMGANYSLLPDTKLGDHKSKPCAILAARPFIHAYSCNSSFIFSRLLMKSRFRHTLLNDYRAE